MDSENVFAQDCQTTDQMLSCKRVAPKLTAQQTTLVQEVKMPWTHLYIPEGLGK